MFNFFVSLPPQFYKLQVVDFTPKCGSTLGGTKMRVKGKGFCGNVSDIEVKIGDAECSVVNVHKELIECTTASSATVVTVDNNGRHPRNTFFYLLY